MKVVKGQSFFHARTPSQVSLCIALADVDELGLLKVLRTEYRGSREQASLSPLYEIDVMAYDRNTIFDWTSEVIRGTISKIEERKKIRTLADIPKECW